MKTIKRVALSLVAVAGFAVAAFGAQAADARYEVPVMESECPSGTHPQLVANPSLPGYPVYCAPN